MIVEVQCFKAGTGIQLVFLDENDMVDVFEFQDKQDVDYIMSLIRIQVPSDALMVEARDRTQTTVH